MNQSSSSLSVDFSFDNTGSGTVQIYFRCGQSDAGQGTCKGGQNDYSVGSVDLSKLPYNPETPATNITSGKVYNQNSVANGNDKPDWNFYVTWSGESAGTHKITSYRLEVLKGGSSSFNINGVTKNTRYNFEKYLPKCKVRRNL